MAKGDTEDASSNLEVEISRSVGKSLALLRNELAETNQQILEARADLKSLRRMSKTRSALRAFLTDLESEAEVENETETERQRQRDKEIER
tara:strand:+ start:1164 stop:1436 length:273 start_codon:yes stop_codon:yes gene_type:complete